MCILRCLSLKKKEEKKKDKVSVRRAHFAARPKAPASPPRDTWKISARQREAMGDVDPRGSRQVNPCLQHWDTAASKHEEGGRGEGVKYFQPFSLVCISWCLLQLCAESERTTDVCTPKDLLSPGRDLWLCGMRFCNRYICAGSSKVYMHYPSVHSLQWICIPAGLEYIYIFLLW